MMSKKCWFPLMLCLMVISPLSYAIEKDAAYWGIAVGRSDDDKFGETATASKLLIGKMFTRNLAGEFAFVHLGEYDVGTTEITQYGFEASLVPMLRVNENTSLFARFGVFAWTFDIDTTLGSGDEKNTDVFYGVGVEYSFTQRASLTVEYEVFEVFDGDVDMISFGMKLGF